MALEDELLGLVPVAALQGALQAVIVAHVQVGKDAILIGQTAECRLACDGVRVRVGFGGVGSNAARDVGGHGSAQIACGGESWIGLEKKIE